MNIHRSQRTPFLLLRQIRPKKSVHRVPRELPLNVQPGGKENFRVKRKTITVLRNEMNNPKITQEQLNIKIQK